MNQSLDNIEPGSIRHEIFKNALKFKSNWVDLGKLLSTLIKTGEYKKWGFDSIEDYCSRELKIKPETAMKLIVSFNYIRKHKPVFTEPENLSPVPDYKVIDCLVKTEKNSDINEENIKQLRQSVFNNGIKGPALRKQIAVFEKGESYSAEKDETVLFERLKRAFFTLKKIIPVFSPHKEVLISLSSLEDFIEQVDR